MAFLWFGTTGHPEEKQGGAEEGGGGRGEGGVKGGNEAASHS